MSKSELPEVSEAAPSQSADELPRNPMDVHASREEYFTQLAADPYGFNNTAYVWKYDTRFAMIERELPWMNWVVIVSGCSHPIAPCS